MFENLSIISIDKVIELKMLSRYLGNEKPVKRYCTTFFFYFSDECKIIFRSKIKNQILVIDTIHNIIHQICKA